MFHEIKFLWKPNNWWRSTRQWTYHLSQESTDSYFTDFVLVSDYWEAYRWYRVRDFSQKCNSVL